MFLDSVTASLCSDAPPPSVSFSSPPSRVVLICDGAAPTGHSSTAPVLLAPVRSFGSRAILRHCVARCLQSAAGCRRIFLLSLLLPVADWADSLLRAAEAAAASASTSAASSSHVATQRLDAVMKQKLVFIDAVSSLSLVDDDDEGSSGNSGSASSAGSSPVATPAAAPIGCFQEQLECYSLSQLPRLTSLIAQMVAASASAPSVLVVDGLSVLLLLHSPPAVISWLLELSDIPQLSLLLHADSAVHTMLAGFSTAAAALTRLAFAGITATECVQEQSIAASSSASRTEFVLSVSLRQQRSGDRVLTWQERWLLVPPSPFLSVTQQTAAPASSSCSPPVDAASAALSALLLSSASSSSPSPPPPSAVPSSSFNLTLTAAQRAAKARTSLPFQHTGEVRVSFGQAGLELSRPTADEDDEELDEQHDEDDDGDADDDLDI